MKTGSEIILGTRFVWWRCDAWGVLCDRCLEHLDAGLFAEFKEVLGVVAVAHNDIDI